MGQIETVAELVREINKLRNSLRNAQAFHWQFVAVVTMAAGGEIFLTPGDYAAAQKVMITTGKTPEGVVFYRGVKNPQQGEDGHEPITHAGLSVSDDGVGGGELRGGEPGEQPGRMAAGAGSTDSDANTAGDLGEPSANPAGDSK
jgi:hypothetical protein